MRQLLITKLRDKDTKREVFRHKTDMLSDLLAFEVASALTHISVLVESPLQKTNGEKLLNDQVIVPILRAGLAMLPAFLRVFPKARVGFLGMRRDEKTHKAKLYYENLPTILPSTDVIILDPMIATGGSAIVALNLMREHKGDLAKIYYAGIIAAPEGIKNIKNHFPKTKIFVGQVDEGLDQNKFIVPGLGDFGDRYFGMENELS